MADLDRMARDVHDRIARIGKYRDARVVGNVEEFILAALRRVEAETREECARLAEGFERNRDWVPGSLYDTLRRETAAVIRTSKEGEA